MKILDPDCKSTWAGFEHFVYDEQVWHKIKSKLDLGDQPGNKFFDQLGCAEDSLKDDFVRFLRQKGKEILACKYTHVAGYHGCRPRDPTSYHSHGILPSNTEVIISEAQVLFNGIEGLDGVINNIKTQNKDYLEHNKGKIGLL